MNQRKRRIIDTAYLAKVAILSALAYVLYAFAAFPIFPVFPFNQLDLDFSFVPALLGGFALGPSATIIIETIKILVKMLTNGSNTFFVGDLSNFIVSLAFVLPASLYYRSHRTFKGALVSLLIGVAAEAVLSCVSNYFIMCPLYGQFAAVIMEPEVRVLFSFAYGLAFNLIKTVSSSVIVVLIYKRLSPILKLDGQKIRELRVYGTTFTKSAEETEALGARLAKRLKGGERIILTGDLGAGKTTFTKGLAKGLGINETVLSPTFVISKSYEGKNLTLNHLDMYRLEDEDETETLGIDDMLSDDKAVTVIEWNKIESLKGRIIDVKIEYGEGEDGRKITVGKRDEK